MSTILYKPFQLQAFCDHNFVFLPVDFPGNQAVPKEINPQIPQPQPPWKKGVVLQMFKWLRSESNTSNFAEKSVLTHLKSVFPSLTFSWQPNGEQVKMDQCIHFIVNFHASFCNKLLDLLLLGGERFDAKDNLTLNTSTNIWAKSLYNASNGISSQQ